MKWKEKAERAREALVEMRKHMSEGQERVLLREVFGAELKPILPRILETLTSSQLDEVLRGLAAGYHDALRFGHQDGYKPPKPEPPSLVIETARDYRSAPLLRCPHCSGVIRP